MKLSNVYIFFLVVFVVFIGVIVFISVVHSPFFYNPCCEGCNNTCTDVYFEPLDNLCHLTMCEHSGLPFFVNCTYQPYCPPLEGIGGIS